MQRQVRLLASDADVQLGFYDPRVCSSDELALDFDDAFQLARSDLMQAPVASSALPALERLDGYLDELSGPNPGFWSDAGVRMDDRWDRVRLLAREALIAMGGSERGPLSDPGTYVVVGTDRAPGCSTLWQRLKARFLGHS